MKTSQSPLVSVCCLTYNHNDYLEDALNSILDQKVDFALELIVHDDASTDGTVDLIKKYADSYPEIVKPILRPNNLMSSGLGIFQIYTQYLFPLAKGKYIAICEGDDFWTDRTKLQQQIDFLEENPQYSLCFHKVGILKNEHTNFDIYDEYHRRILGDRTEFTFTDLLKDNIIPNCSVVYRNIISDFPDLFKNLIFPDWPLHILYAEQGKLGYINKFMAVHREHNLGLWNGSPHVERVKSIIGFYMDLLQHCGQQYHTIINESLERYTKGTNPADLGRDFEIGYSYGAFKKQQETDNLRNTLNIITQSGSYRLSQQIGRLIKLFSKRKN